MIKILILLLLVGAITSIGVLLSKNKKKKLAILSELYEFNERLLINLKYNKKPLEEVASDFKYIPAILRGENVAEGDDKKTVADYFANLGKSDAMSQIDYLNGKRAALSKLKDESFKNYKKYSSLYIKIFFMLGVLAAVLLA